MPVHAAEHAEASTQDDARIRTTIESFATLADQNAFTTLGRLFTDNVVVDYSSAFGGKPTNPTRVELMQQWAGLLPGFATTRHALSNLQIRIDGNKASVTADITASHYLEPASEALNGFWQISGTYHFGLTRADDNNWQIHQLTLEAKEEQGSRDVLAEAGKRAAHRLAIKNAQRITLNTTAAQDAQAINDPLLWPKPADPTAAGSENSPALKVVQAFFEAYGKQDLNTLKTLVAEDVEWHMPGTHALAGTKQGADEFISLFGKLGEAGFNAEPMLLAANDHHVVDAHRGWSTNGSSRGVDDIDLNWILLYQVTNGKIKRVQNFSGDLYRSDAFFDAFFTAGQNGTADGAED